MSGIASQVIADIQRYQRQAASLLLYQSVLENPIGDAWTSLLAALVEGKEETCLRAYGQWFHAQSTGNQTWRRHLIRQILEADNAFTQQAQQGAAADFPPSLLDAVRHDLRLLQSLYACQGEQLSQWMQTICQTPQSPVVWSPLEPTVSLPLLDKDDWADGLEALAAYHRQHGSGLFAQYRALRWRNGKLLGIPHPDPIQLSQLAAYDSPKSAVIKNTEFLLADYRALHVLLYGGRGLGKSSLVKALLNEYGDRGLRLIEVAKADLQALPTIVERLRPIPQKFIIFVDDLSFEEDDEAFKALKGVLEGSVTAQPQNVVVYATSNRRHLVREFFAERPRPKDSDEIQAWDTMQEKLSFSDRFGLTVTFEPADQPTYLSIVAHLARQSGIELPKEDLEFRALQWATRHNGRSGRTARQFIDFLQAELAMMELSS
ncbi:MAG: ATP-binding protein [Leptolyngbyaceae cyanobacterium MO_188.B28]|nr:ATP-binding protein [Leptolyngbyaceae cyanobacterium MO_188.B28]